MMAARIIPPITGFLLTDLVMFTSNFSHRNLMNGKPKFTPEIKNQL
jgi:hypothetical protein